MIDPNHGVQYIRCKCGRSYLTLKEWMEHYKYRYLMVNKDLLPPENISEAIEKSIKEILDHNER